MQDGCWRIIIGFPLSKIKSLSVSPIDVVDVAENHLSHMSKAMYDRA